MLVYQRVNQLINTPGGVHPARRIVDAASAKKAVGRHGVPHEQLTVICRCCF